MQSRIKQNNPLLSRSANSNGNKAQGCYVCISHVSIEHVALDRVLEDDSFWAKVEQWRRKGGANPNITDGVDGDSDTTPRSGSGSVTPRSKSSLKGGSCAESPGFPSSYTGTKKVKNFAIKNFAPKKKLLIGSLDVAQKLSGVPLKLVTFETLLADYPVWKHHVTLMQVVTIPGSRPADEALTLREIRTIVGRIRAKYGSGVIVYEEVQGVDFELKNRVAMYEGERAKRAGCENENEERSEYY